MTVKTNFNVYSKKAQQVLAKNMSALGKMTQQLASGTKINQAQDDPVIFSISKNLEMQLNATSTVINNLEYSKDFIAVAETGMTVVNEHLERIRALCLQGSTNIFNSTQKQAIVNEINERLDEINRLSAATIFDDISLLDGSCSNMKLQIGSKSNINDNTLDIGSALIDIRTNALGLDYEPFERGNLITCEEFRDYLDVVDSATEEINSNLSKIGAYINSLDTKTDLLTQLVAAKSSYKSTMMDTDVASAASELTKYQILENMNVAVLQQANQLPSIALQLLG